MEETIKILEKMDANILRVDPEETKAIRNAIKYLKEYQMFKTLYMARLKIDMVAMLEEMSLEMDELTPPKDLRTDFYCHGVIDSQYIVDKKIQELKGENM